mmetsp:Transcript_8263/g.26399  ORF Transcript_8263/g.26399 Transcript_8263/m.26399 type:complete len:208 (-) Transcript_8263:87-710(-)
MRTEAPTPVDQPRRWCHSCTGRCRCTRRTTERRPEATAAPGTRYACCLAACARLLRHCRETERRWTALQSPTTPGQERRRLAWGSQGSTHAWRRTNTPRGQRSAGTTRCCAASAHPAYSRQRRWACCPPGTQVLPQTLLLSHPDSQRERLSCERTNRGVAVGRSLRRSPTRRSCWTFRTCRSENSTCCSQRRCTVHLRSIVWLQTQP